MKALKTAFPLLVLLLSLLLLTPLASASTPTTGSGSFTSTASNISVRHVDGNTIITATETQTLSGFFRGTRVAEGIQVIHPDGTFNAHDTGTFTGTADGRSGTVVITGSSTGVGDSGSGQLVAELGTGGLAGLHAQGTFQPTITGPTTAAGTYSVQFHFDV
jgi:Protein of unknown function (DUF3224)